MAHARMQWSVLVAGLVILAGRLPAEDVVSVVGRESLGRMPVEGTEDFRLVTNRDLSKVAVMDRWGDEHKWYVVENSLVWEFYTQMDAASAQFAPSGELTLLAQHDGKWFLIAGNKDVRALGEGACRGLALSVDGKHDACIQKIAGGEQVLLDGKAVQVAGGALPLLEEVAGLTFSRDGRLAFTARAGGKGYVLLEGVVLGSIEAERMLAPVFSGDEKHVLNAGTQRDGKMMQIVRLSDGAIVETHRGTMENTQVTALAQSGDGQHVVWGEKDALGVRLKVDGKVQEKIATMEIAEVAMSADGKHWAWRSQGDGTKDVELGMDERVWTLPKAKPRRLTMTDDGRGVHLAGAGERHDFALVGGDWKRWVAASFEDKIEVIPWSATYVNGKLVDNGHFLEAVATDEHTVNVLSRNDLPVQVNDKKLGEITRTQVRVTQRVQPAGQ